MSKNLVLSCSTMVAIVCVAASSSIPAGAAATAPRRNCAHPLTLSLHESDLRVPTNGENKNFKKGAFFVGFKHTDWTAEIGGGPSRDYPWRSCEMTGTDNAGNHWRVPAPVGPRGGFHR